MITRRVYQFKWILYLFIYFVCMVLYMTSSRLVYLKLLSSLTSGDVNVWCVAARHTRTHESQLNPQQWQPTDELRACARVSVADTQGRGLTVTRREDDAAVIAHCQLEVCGTMSVRSVRCRRYRYSRNKTSQHSKVASKLHLSTNANNKFPPTI